MSWKLTFRLQGVHEIAESMGAIWFDVSVIGNIKPLAWSGAALPMKNDVTSESEWIANVTLEEDEPLRYRYLIRVLKENGEIVHCLEGNFEKKDRIVSSDTEIVHDEFHLAMKISENDMLRRPACECPWVSPVIGSDGRVTVCCADDQFTLNIGDIRKESLQNIWHSRQAWLTRLWHIRGNFHWLPACNGCVHWRERPLPENKVVDTIDKLGLAPIEEIRYRLRCQGVYPIKRYLMVELTDHCPLKCIWCNQIHENWNKVHGTSDKGYMSSETFDAMISSVREMTEENGQPFTSIALFWMGEPLAHPRFKEFLRKISDANKNLDLAGKLEIHTNGLMLAKDEVDAILAASESSPITLHLSLDADTAATYERCKGVDGFDKAVRASKAVLDRMQQSVDSFPQKETTVYQRLKNFRFVIQLVVAEQNREEVPSFISRWKKEADNRDLPSQITMYHDHSEPVVIFIRKMDAPEGIDDERVYRYWQKVCDNAELSDAVPERWIPEPPAARYGSNKGLCASLWESLAIRWDGAVTPCCHDTGLGMNVGNINDTSLLEITSGKVMTNLRLQHIRGEVCGICADCSVKASPNMHAADDRDVIEWLLNNGFSRDAALWLSGESSESER